MKASFRSSTFGPLKAVESGAEAMGRQLIAFAAHAENLNLILTTHTWQLTTASDSSSGDLTSCGFYGH